MKKIKNIQLRVWVILFLVLFVNVYYLAKGYLEVYFPSKEVLFIQEKAYLTLYGDTPNLALKGVVKPLLPYLINLAIPDIVILTALTSALLVFTLFYFLSRKNFHPVLSFIMFVAVIFNPLFILMIFKNYIFSLTILILISGFLNMYIFLYYKPKSYRYLFISAFMLGMLFLIDYRTLFVLPVFSLFPLISEAYNSAKKYERINIKRIINVASIVLTPTIFFILFYYIANYLLTARWSFDLNNPYLTFLYKPSIFFSDWKLLIYRVLEDINKYWYLILPAVVFPLFTRKKAFMIMLFLIPILFMAGIYTFSEKIEIYYFIIFSLLALISIIDMKRDLDRFSLSILGAVMVISIFFTIKYIGYGVLFEKEKDLVEMKKGAEILKIYEGNIMLDDASLYPFVVFLGKEKIKDVIVPNDDTFTYYFGNPKDSIHFIVVNRDYPRDKFLLNYPNAKYGYMEGYYVFYENTKITIFKNANLFSGSFADN